MTKIFWRLKHEIPCEWKEGWIANTPARGLIKIVGCNDPAYPYYKILSRDEIELIESK